MTEISLSGRGARGESQADILRRTGQFGALPTDTDAEAMAKLNADAAAAADAAAGFALVAETTATGGWFDSLAAGAADVAEGEGYFVKDAEDRFYTAQKVGGIGVKGAEFTTAALFGAATGAALIGTENLRPLSELIAPLVKPTGRTIAATITATNSAQLVPGATFNETGITLSHHQSIIGNNAVIASQSVGPVFALSGFRPLLQNFYMQGFSGSGYAITVDGGFAAAIHDVVITNAGTGGIQLKNNVADPSGCRSGNVENVFLQDLTGPGFNITTGVNKFTFDGCEAFGKIDYALGLGKPRAGSIGWLINPANKAIAVGGHQFVNCRAEALAMGWDLNGTELLMLSNCFADGTSDYGLRVTSCNDLDIDQFFCGTTRGIWIGGTSTQITLRGLSTRFTGLIPPWGAADFFNGVSTFYDVTIADTAVVTIEGDSWRGGRLVSVASGAKLNVTGGQRVELRSETAVAASTTVYIKPGGGTTTTESEAVFRAEFDGVLFLIQADSTDTPSSGNHVYTVRKSATDTALACSTPSGSFKSRDYDGSITVNRGDQLSVKLVTGPGPAAIHSAFVQVLPQ